jgi:sulfur relay (sulfurtransferase) complex TusBCD TusD component (DsrE family)
MFSTPVQRFADAAVCCSSCGFATRRARKHHVTFEALLMLLSQCNIRRDAALPLCARCARKRGVRAQRAAVPAAAEASR